MESGANAVVTSRIPEVCGRERPQGRCARTGEPLWRSRGSSTLVHRGPVREVDRASLPRFVHERGHRFCTDPCTAIHAARPPVHGVCAGSPQGFHEPLGRAGATPAGALLPRWPRPVWSGATQASSRQRPRRRRSSRGGPDAGRIAASPWRDGSDAKRSNTRRGQSRPVDASRPRMTPATNAEWAGRRLLSGRPARPLDVASGAFTPSSSRGRAHWRPIRVPMKPWTSAAIASSFWMRFVILSTAYMTVVWSRPPKKPPISSRE